MTYSNKNKIIFTEDYQKFFKKHPFAKIVQTRGSNKISQYLKLDLENHISEINNYFCINDNDNSLDHIIQNEQHFKILDEGLITTYPTQKVINHFKKFFKKIVDQELVDLEMPDKTKIIDFCILSDPKEKISPQIMVCVPAKDNDDIKRLIKLLTDDFVKCGYYMISYDITDSSLFKYVYVQFEAKYNDMLIDINDVLYHVSPLKYLPKILKTGLVPYSKSNVFKYDDRVYLFNRCSKDIIYEYGAYKAKECNDNGFCVFKVFKNKLISDPIFKDGKHKFYLDTAFSMSDDGSTDQTGIFTYNNIPKRLLSKYYVEVKIDDYAQIISQETKIIK